MKIVIQSVEVETLFPITGDVAAIRVAGHSLADLIRHRLDHLPETAEVKVRGDFLPSAELAAELKKAGGPVIVRDPADGAELLELKWSGSHAAPQEIPPDPASRRLFYPWDLLALNEQLVGELDYDDIQGTVYDGAVLDGRIRLGHGSVILPGVYVEGNAVFGENCKIGPNCYIRGNTTIGDHCHIGQAVEVKNSLLADHVGIGHLSYVGDSIICRQAHFGGGTILSNLRHDGKPHRFKVKGELIDTGRRKFGAVIGENVHTGIHTAIYPGRMLPPGAETRPGEVVNK